ncbi:MAG: Gfo/Idh/MocA family oxidoreductase [Fidelibacterota bacterium]|nr:MAG: Gfo/Idh/MocA family oxidoreductase [Candidatus Neomarinimicrobiota bacterium]
MDCRPIGKHGGFKITAVADYFKDRADLAGEQFKVSRKRRYTNLSAYKSLIENGGVEAVAIESPPYFHPEQAAAAIEAGKHVYLAKPAAVDVPGCQTIEENGKKATAANLVFLVDFQTRNNGFFQEAVKRAQYGDIGVPMYGDANFLSGSVGLVTDPGGPEETLRNWMSNKLLSGDVIVEQSIHSIDVATWILDEHPLSAYGLSARNTEYEDPNDYSHYFTVNYLFPDDVSIIFSGKRGGKGAGDILCRIFGTKGTIDTHYMGQVSISGDTPYKGGNTFNIYTEGAVNNIATFHDNITKERYTNTTVGQSVRSNLAAILGRMSAYTREEVTWDEMLAKGDKWVADLSGLKS